LKRGAHSDNNSALTVLVPVFNEQETILALLTRLNSLRSQIKNLFIFVIDDGSIDDTETLLMLNPNLYDKLIRFRRNGGKGKAIAAALSQVSEGYVLIQDADLEYDPLEIPKLWQVLNQNGAQVVHTNRLSGATLTRVHYFWHKVGNRLITFIFNITNNTTFCDIYSGYLMFEVSLLHNQKLKFRRWGQQAEILTILVHRAERIYEVPISYFGRSYEEGKKIRASATLGVLSAMFLTKIRTIFI